MAPKREPKSTKNQSKNEVENLCKNSAKKTPAPYPQQTRKKVPFLEGNIQKNNKQQKTNSDCARWSAKGEGECRKERGARVGSQHASGANGPERISVAYGNIPAAGRRKEKNPKWSVSSDRVWVPRGSGCCERKVSQYQKNKHKENH